MTRHVVWDWNGTLLADQHAVLDALNVLLDSYDLPATDMETYRRLYTRPVRRFYERLLVRAIDDAEWEHIDDLFHQAYAAALERVQLADDAVEVLTAVIASGRTQSLLSMARHDHLVPLVTRFGIEERFVRVEGLRGRGGGLKAGHLEAHLLAVADAAGEDPQRVVVIGDAVDDAVAAAHVRARCVLYDGGSHPVEALVATGVPVVGTLMEALDVAGID
jgi:phosphoglycolate phosphatase-like HAD superfamily hydrolase